MNVVSANALKWSVLPHVKKDFSVNLVNVSLNVKQPVLPKIILCVLMVSIIRIHALQNVRVNQTFKGESVEKDLDVMKIVSVLGVIFAKKVDVKPLTVNAKGKPMNQSVVHEDRPFPIAVN